MGSILFPSNISFQIFARMYGEETALLYIKHIIEANKYAFEYQNKSAVDYAHFLISYCAVSSGNLSWLEELDDTVLKAVTIEAYKNMYG